MPFREKAVVSGSKFIGNFPERLMEKIINSTLFIYPSLLPKVPFRKDSNKPSKKLDVQNSEIS